uniref:HAD-IC family P-type ATPase n=1 Tax=Escherichia coli TaxID=562 RepID=UPI00132F5197
YAPVVHATALLTMLAWLAYGASFHDSIVTAIAVLIITCPCALGLAIPTVQTVASGALFGSGVLLNAGDAIERIAEIDRVIFDKTGTLTLPELDVANLAEIPEDVVRLAG